MNLFLCLNFSENMNLNEKLTTYHVVQKKKKNLKNQKCAEMEN